VKVDEIKKIALRMGMAPNKMNKAELIRSIQCREGNNQCFNTGTVQHCGQDGCLWRDDCK